MSKFDMLLNENINFKTKQAFKNMWSNNFFMNRFK